MKKDRNKFPSFYEQVKNLSKLASDVTKDFLDDKPILANKDVQENRLKICSDCDHNHEGRCTLCGCWLENKVKFSSSHCPIMKWDFNSESHN